jgi:hypothetical protein
LKVSASERRLSFSRRHAGVPVLLARARGLLGSRLPQAELRRPRSAHHNLSDGVRGPRRLRSREASGLERRNFRRPSPRSQPNVGACTGADASLRCPSFRDEVVPDPPLGIGRNRHDHSSTRSVFPSPPVGSERSPSAFSGVAVSEVYFPHIQPGLSLLPLDSAGR